MAQRLTSRRSTASVVASDGSIPQAARVSADRRSYCRCAYCDRETFVDSLLRVATAPVSGTSKTSRRKQVMDRRHNECKESPARPTRLRSSHNENLHVVRFLGLRSNDCSRTRSRTPLPEKCRQSPLPLGQWPADRFSRIHQSHWTLQLPIG